MEDVKKVRFRTMRPRVVSDVADQPRETRQCLVHPQHPAPHPSVDERFQFETGGIVARRRTAVSAGAACLAAGLGLAVVSDSPNAVSSRVQPLAELARDSVVSAVGVERSAINGAWTSTRAGLRDWAADRARERGRQDDHETQCPRFTPNAHEARPFLTTSCKY